MASLRGLTAASTHVRTLRAALPWTISPLVVGAPMRVLAGPELAVAVSEAGGIGFLGPGEKPADLEKELKEATQLISRSAALSRALSQRQHNEVSISHSTPSSQRTVTADSTDLDNPKPTLIPIGVGFQTWAGDLSIATRILLAHPPAAAWLFAPRNGQQELDDWTRAIRSASPDTMIWIQVASVADALAAAQSSYAPDVLVIQGADAGGHSLTHGAGIMALLPEVADSLADGSRAGIPLIAAGGIADSRGMAAAFALGASGVAMGTRFLASREARINPGYQRHVVEASDGGQTTVRTQLYNHLRGTFNWPAPFDARGLVNQSWRDHVTGVPFEKNQELYVQAKQSGEQGWGATNGRMATYAGTAVGLIREVEAAGEIVSKVRDGTTSVLRVALDHV